MFWLALAATQHEHGRLQPDVKRGALDVIARGDRRWQGSPDAAKRQRALERLAAKLASPLPKRRTPRRRALQDIPSTRVPSPDGTASASVFAIQTLAQVSVEVQANGTAGGGGVFAAECAMEEIALRWLDAATLEVSYPSSARIHKQEAQSYFDGRVTRVVYRPR